MIPELERVCDSAAIGYHCPGDDNCDCDMQQAEDRANCHPFLVTSSAWDTLHRNAMHFPDLYGEWVYRAEVTEDTDIEPRNPISAVAEATTGGA